MGRPGEKNQKQLELLRGSQPKGTHCLLKYNAISTHTMPGLRQRGCVFVCVRGMEGEDVFNPTSVYSSADWCDMELGLVGKLAFTVLSCCSNT